MGGDQPAYQNSGLRRFGTPQAYTPYTPGQFSAPTFQAPQLAPRQRFAPPQAPAMGGLLSGDSYGGGGPNVGDPSSSPVSSTSTPGAMSPAVSGLATMGISALTGVPAFAIQGLLGMANGGASAPSSSVGVGAAPGTPGGIGVAVGGDGSEGAPGSVGSSAADAGPGVGVGGIGDDGTSGDGGGGGGGGK